MQVVVNRWLWYAVSPPYHILDSFATLSLSLLEFLLLTLVLPPRWKYSQR